MNRIATATTAFCFALTAAACGGGEETGGQTAEQQAAPGAEQAAAGGGQAALTTPSWMRVDNAAGTVTLDIVAGQTGANNSWNFNGHYNGNATIVVPEGYSVTINFQNADQVNPHSLVVDSRTSGFPPIFQEVNPVFEGGATPGAAEMAAATQPGQSETITFTASTAGEYALVCYVPAHAAQGMWIHFNVSAEGEAGVRM